MKENENPTELIDTKNLQDEEDADYLFALKMQNELYEFGEYEEGSQNYGAEGAESENSSFNEHD